MTTAIAGIKETHEPQLHCTSKHLLPDVQMRTVCDADVLGVTVSYLLHRGVPHASAATTAAALPALVAGLFCTPHMRYFADAKILRNRHLDCCLGCWL